MGVAPAHHSTSTVAWELSLWSNPSFVISGHSIIPHCQLPLNQITLNHPVDQLNNFNFTSIMSRTAATQLAQRATRNLSSRWTSRSTIVSPLLTHRATSQTFNASRCAVSQMSRSISTTRMYRVGLQPDTSNPKPKEAESNETASSSSKVELSEERYNQLSESYLNTLVEQLEELQEQREDVDVEYSVCPSTSYTLLSGIDANNSVGWCAQPKLSTKWKLCT